MQRRRGRHHHDPPPATPRESRLREYLGLLRFPTLVTLLLTLPAVMVGPLAFAMREDFAFSRTDIGNAYAAFFLLSAVFAVVGARPVAYIGATRLMRYGLLCQAAVFALGALAERTEMIYAMTMAGGAVNGLTTVAVNLAIMSSVPAHRRGLAFGLRVASVPTGATIIGIGASLVAADLIAWRALFWFATALSIAVALTVRRRKADDDGERVTPRTDVQGDARNFRGLLVGGFLGAMAMSPLPGFTVEGLIASGQSPATAGAILAIAGWVGIVSRIAIGAMGDKLPDARHHLRIVCGLLLVLVPSMTCLAFATDTLLLTAAAMLSLGLGFAWPGLLYFAAMSTHRERATKVASTMQAGQNMGGVIGPIAFGFIAGHIAFSSAWMTSAALATLSAVIIAFTARGLTKTLRRSRV